MTLWDNLNAFDHAELVANWEKIDRHSGTICGCIKRCVYDGGAGYGHREAVKRDDEPKHEALTWTF